MSKRTHNDGIYMSKSGICLQSILYYLELSPIMCHGACNCSHVVSLNECVDLYRQNGWYNLGNIINNVIRFGAEKRSLTPEQLRMVYGFLNTQLKMIYKAKGLAAQGLLINTSWAKKYLIDGPKPEGAKAPRIEVLEVAVV
jgi:hypothetical protein